MKNFFHKTTILTVATVALMAGFAVPQNALAAASFNTDPQDYPTVRVANATLNPNCTTCWSTAISNVHSGDIIGVAIYYHNTGTTAANDTLGKLSYSANGSSVSFSGNISASNAAAAYGNAQASFASDVSNPTLAFYRGYWFPNQTQTQTSLPNGQTGQEAMSSGVNIGTINPGWPSQGSIVLQFKVSGGTQGNAPTVQTQPATNITTTSATLNGTVNPHGAATMYWFEYGTTESLGNSTTQASVGSGASDAVVYSGISGLSANTTYYFRVVAQNQYVAIPVRGAILSFTTSAGQEGNAPIVQTQPATNITTTSATLNGTVNPNGAATMYWFEFGTSQSLGSSSPQQNAGSGTSATAVSIGVTDLTPNTTYYFRVVAQNVNGTVQGAILSFTTTSGGSTCTAPSVLTTAPTNVSATSVTLNGSINPNGSLVTYWFEYGTTNSFGNSTNQASVSGNNYQSVSATIYNLSANTTYYFRLVGQNSCGNTVQGSTLTFYPTGGQGGAPLVITNPATNITQTSAMLNGSVNPNGYYTTYWFEYGTSYSLGNTTQQYSLGTGNSYQAVSAYLYSLSANTTYYFRVVAQNQNGTAQGSILSFTTNNGGGGGTCTGTMPSAQTNAVSGVYDTSATFNGYVYNPTSDTYGWFEYGTNYNSLYQTTNNVYVGSSGYYAMTQTVYNLSYNTTYYVRAVVHNSCGTWYGQTLSFTTNGGGGGGNGQAPYVITDPATYIYQSTAMLNGRVNANGYYTYAWFEYGTTQNLGLTSGTQVIGSGTNLLSYSYATLNLAPNTTYYFRAAAHNQYGTNYGSILSFTTGSGGTITTTPPVVIQQPVIIRTTSVGSTGFSCIMLVPALDVSQLAAGQQFTYTITYRNGCAYALNEAFIKVILPTEVDFVSTNYPFFNKDANGISYNLGAVAPNFQSAISVTGVVHKDVTVGSTMIFSAVLNFNDVNGRLQSVAAYLTALVGPSGTVLGATVFDAFAALFGNWIFDLVLFIILVLAVIYWLLFRKKDAHTVTDDKIMFASTTPAPFTNNQQEADDDNDVDVLSPSQRM